MTTPETPATPQDSSTPSAPGWTAFATMGLSSAACVAIGVVLGVVGDAWLHTSPILLLIGIALGCVAAAWGVVVQIKRFL